MNKPFVQRLAQDISLDPPKAGRQCKHMEEIILGVDPGLENTGWAVINCELPITNYELKAIGVIKTSIKDSSAKRLGKIYKELEDIIKKYNVKAMAIETLFFAKNVKSASKVSEAIGVIKVCGRINGLEVAEYTPLQVKMALVGYGRAEKEQVEEMVRAELGLAEPISPSHASDAVAVALTYGFMMKYD